MAAALAGCGVETPGAPVERLGRARAELTSTQDAELTASDGAQGDELGWSVSVDGDTAIVGTPYRDDSAGAAYVFVRDGGAWTQQAELTASDSASQAYFGWSVSISGDTAVVGADSTLLGFQMPGGAAYVFVREGTTWTQQAELMASDEGLGDMFGRSVSVSGGTAVVGAVGHQGGAAYVFTQNGTTWTQEAELTASDEAPGDAFGVLVSLSGGTAVVGSLNHAVEGNATGAAYVFVQNGATWTQEAELTASDGAVEDGFGSSVAVSGSTALVSAYHHQLFTGSAYVFARNGTTWTQEAELTASDGVAGDDFGYSVALSGGVAVVGANGHTTGGDVNAGAAYVFVQNGASWTEEASLAITDPTGHDDLGQSVAVSGGTALVSAILHDAGQGAVYVFDLCTVGGAVYTSGATSPANACQVCAPSTSTTSWSNEPDGTPCPGGTCEAGTCAPFADAGADAGTGGGAGSGTAASSSSSTGSTSGGGAGGSSATASSSAGNSTSGGGAGGSGTTASGGAAGAGGSGGTVIGGCACGTEPSSSPRFAPAVLGILAALVARRRGRGTGCARRRLV